MIRDVVIIGLDGCDRVSAIELDENDEYPGVIKSISSGREWVLARRPGIAENIQSLQGDGSLGPVSTMAEYYESSGVDATCLDCGDRFRFRYTPAADAFLRWCRGRVHRTMLLYVHLDDANVVSHLDPPRTVGDIREHTKLHKVPRFIQWLLRIRGYQV